MIKAECMAKTGPYIRPVLKYKLFEKYLNYYKKNLRLFSSKYKNEWKEHVF